MIKKILIFALLFLSLRVLFWWLNIEFLDARLNILTNIGFVFSLLTICLIVMFADWPKNIWSRIPIILLASICFAIFLIPFSCYLMDAKDIFNTKIDKSYEKLNEIQVGSYFYTTYRSNGGATTDF